MDAVRIEVPTVIIGCDLGSEDGEITVRIVTAERELLLSP